MIRFKQERIYLPLEYLYLCWFRYHWHSTRYNSNQPTYVGTVAAKPYFIYVQVDFKFTDCDFCDCSVSFPIAVARQFWKRCHNLFSSDNIQFETKDLTILDERFSNVGDARLRYFLTLTWKRMTSFFWNFNFLLDHENVQFLWWI